MIVLGSGCLLAPVAFAAEEKAPAESAPIEHLEVNVRLEGVVDGDLNTAVQGVSKTLDEKTFHPTSYGGIRRAARSDADLFKTLLQSKGYYAAQVDFRINGTEAPYDLVFLVELGPQFRVDRTTIVYEDDRDAVRPLSLEDAGLSYEGSPIAAPITKAQSDLQSYFNQNGFPLNRMRGHRLLADFSTGTATLEFRVNSGPLARFGETKWETLERIDPSYVESFITWEEGELFNTESLAKTRQNLSDTGLFSSIEIRPGRDGPQHKSYTRRCSSDGTISPRTVGAGGSYSTSRGPGVRAFFEHRTIMRRGEKLRADISLAQMEQEGRASIWKPFPRRQSQWISEAFVGREETDAYDEERVGVTSAYSKKLSTKLSGRFGVGLEGSRLKDTDGRETIYLASVPIGLTRNTLNSTLNPTKGSRVSVTGTPYIGQSDGFAAFSTLEASAALHQALIKSEKIVAAARARFGTTFAGSEDSLPTNKRYYSGGGGSVRGYGYQLAGPVDENGDPLGGNSVVELGFELRGEVYENTELAAFFEGGTTFESRYPDFSEPLRYGAGLGVRYHTPIGPIRVDFAVPLDRRRDVDDAFQFYISIGQAF